MVFALFTIQITEISLNDFVYRRNSHTLTVLKFSKIKMEFALILHRFHVKCISGFRTPLLTKACFDVWVYLQFR